MKNIIIFLSCMVMLQTNALATFIIPALVLNGIGHQLLKGKGKDSGSGKGNVGLGAQGSGNLGLGAHGSGNLGLGAQGSGSGNLGLGGQGSGSGSSSGSGSNSGSVSGFGSGSASGSGSGSGHLGLGGNLGIGGNLGLGAQGSAGAQGSVGAGGSALTPSQHSPSTPDSLSTLGGSQSTQGGSPSTPSQDSPATPDSSSTPGGSQSTSSQDSSGDSSQGSSSQDSATSQGSGSATGHGSGSETGYGSGSGTGQASGSAMASWMAQGSSSAQKSWNSHGSLTTTKAWAQAPFIYPNPIIPLPKGGGNGQFQMSEFNEEQKKCLTSFANKGMSTCLSDIANSYLTHKINIGPQCCSALDGLNDACRQTIQFKNPVFEGLVKKHCSAAGADSGSGGDESAGRSVLEDWTTFKPGYGDGSYTDQTGVLGEGFGNAFGTAPSEGPSYFGAPGPSFAEGPNSYKFSGVSASSFGEDLTSLEVDGASVHPLGSGEKVQRTLVEDPNTLQSNGAPPKPALPPVNLKYFFI